MFNRGQFFNKYLREPAFRKMSDANSVKRIHHEIHIFLCPLLNRPSLYDGIKARTQYLATFYRIAREKSLPEPLLTHKGFSWEGFWVELLYYVVIGATRHKFFETVFIYILKSKIPWQHFEMLKVQTRLALSSCT